MNADISVFDILSTIPLAKLALKVASKSKFVREDIALLARDEAAEWLEFGDVLDFRIFGLYGGRQGFPFLSSVFQSSLLCNYFNMLDFCLNFDHTTPKYPA